MHHVLFARDTKSRWHLVGLNFARLSLDLFTGITDRNQSLIDGGDILAGILRHQLAEVFDNPEVVLVHDKFPLGFNRFSL